MPLTKSTSVRKPTQIKTMLVIEDNPDQQLLIKVAFEKVFQKARLVLATNAQQVLTYFEQCLEEGRSRPQLVLLDLYLPLREDGWQVLDMIRAMPAPFNALPVVILSSSTESQDIIQAYERSVSSYIVKPLQVDEWGSYFQTLKEYWDETVCLPGVRLF